MEEKTKKCVSDKNDASYVAEAGQKTVQQLYDYSIAALIRVGERFKSLDSKASQTIGLIGIVGGILVFTFPSSEVKDGNIKILLSVGAFFLILAALFSLLALRVRTTNVPPTVKRVIKWLHKQNKSALEIKMLSSLIIDISNSEHSHIKACEKKASLLSIGQMCEVIGFVTLLGYFVFSKIHI